MFGRLVSAILEVPYLEVAAVMRTDVVWRTPVRCCFDGTYGHDKTVRIMLHEATGACRNVLRRACRGL